MSSENHYVTAIFELSMKMQNQKGKCRIIKQAKY